MIQHLPPVDPLDLANQYIVSAQRRFGNAARALDEQDERLRDVLEIRNAIGVLADDIVVAFHHESEYIEAKKDTTMQRSEGKIDGAVAEGKLGGDQAIRNYDVLALSGLRGAVVAMG